MERVSAAFDPDAAEDGSTADRKPPLIPSLRPIVVVVNSRGRSCKRPRSRRLYAPQTATPPDRTREFERVTPPLRRRRGEVPKLSMCLYACATAAMRHSVATVCGRLMARVQNVSFQSFANNRDHAGQAAALAASTSRRARRSSICCVRAARAFQADSERRQRSCTLVRSAASNSARAWAALAR